MHKYALLFLLAGCDISLISSTATPSPFYNVKYIDNYDGDTITVTLSDSSIPLVFSQAIPVRIRHIDTAELTADSLCEKKMALLAKEAVADLLKNAKRIDLETIGRDKYFRLLADVIAYQRDNKKIDIGFYLLQKSLAVPYEGNTKLAVSWCRLLKETRKLN